jgi:hypothetical protein
MFQITSTRPITWPGFDFKLERGINEIESRRAVPPELRPKLLRFRALKLIDFAGDFSEEALKETTKLAELTQRQLYAKDKAALAELAKAEGIAVPEGASKKQLVEALEPKCKPLPKLEEPLAEKPAEGDKADDKGPGKRGGRAPALSAPVSGETVVK